MIKKLAESITWSNKTCEPTDIKCEKCGWQLFRYTGAPVKEWDSQRGVYNTHQTGETLPCHNCSWVMEGLAVEQGKLNYMQHMTNRPKSDKETDEMARRRQELAGMIEEAQRKEFNAICAETGYTVAQVADYVYTSRRRKILEQYR